MKPLLSYFLLLASLFSSYCFADNEWPPPLVTPMNETKDMIQPQMDRSSLPTDSLYVYQNHVTGNAVQPTTLMGTGYVCLSNTNSINGRCPTGMNTGAANPSPITLRFTESKSHITQDLLLYARKAVISNTYYYQAMNSTTGASGGTGAALTLYLPQTELKKLPVGGVWTAKLILNYRYSSVLLSTYTINFRFDITDKSNIQVYLPQFGNAAMPQVDLNIRPKSSANGFAGKNTIDMCLYDGYNTNSSSMVIQFAGVNDGGVGTNTFYLRKNDDANVTLPYKVSFGFTGESPGRSIINGENWSINQAQQLPINWNRITSVGIPNISVPVLCWPAQMTISTDLPASQASGAYSGVIKMIFTPSTTSM